MILMNRSKEIGKIISIDGMKVEIELYEFLSTSQYLTSNSDIFEIGGVGNYLKTKKIDGELIIEILSEYATESVENEKKQNDNIKKPIIKRIIKGKIKGKLFYNGKYNMGIYDSPMVFDAVYLTDENDVEKIYVSNAKSSELFVGNVVLNENINFAIDINSFFASHIAILGNTGSGKSNTLATLYERLFYHEINGLNFVESANKASKFIVFDTNGEYINAFTDDEKFKKIIRVNTRKSEDCGLCIPISCTDAEDWGIILNATDRTQQPIIDKAFYDLKKMNTYGNTIVFIENRIKIIIKKILNSNKSSNQKLNSLNSLKDLVLSFFNLIKYKNYVSIQSIDDIFKFDVIYGQIAYCGLTDIATVINLIDSKKILLQNVEQNQLDNKVNSSIEEIDFLLNLNYQYNINAYDVNENFIGPLLSRFNSIKNNLGKIFCESSFNEENSLVNLLFEDANLLILDVSCISTKMRIAITSLIANKLYKYYESVDKRNEQSMHIIIDEAHNYLNSKNIENEDKMALKSIEVYEKIIKEGRKFSVYLTISSQRPADISNTILSQCHNYVIHRLANPNDINQIYNVVSFIDSRSIEMLPILAPGQAIFSGTSFSSPTLVQIKRPKYNVDSENTNLTNLWYGKK